MRNNNKIFDIKLFKFVLVGVGNTILSAAIMFGLYNLFKVGYWGASAISYLIGSILSYFMNKNFTFKNEEAVIRTVVKFTANAVVCYILAYTVSKPVVIYSLSTFTVDTKVIEQVAMLLGMCIYTGLNYIGQRFFVFK